MERQYKLMAEYVEVLDERIKLEKEENQSNPKKASGLAARLESMQKQVEEMQKQRNQ